MGLLDGVIYKKHLACKQLSAQSVVSIIIMTLKLTIH